MKVYRKVLRGWIAITSVFTFLGGWIILAHSPKPVQTQTTTSTIQSVNLPNLPAIQAYGSTNSEGPSFFSNRSPSTTAPAIQQSTGQTFLRTRGS